MSRKITITDIAQACHEANRVFQIAMNESANDIWEDTTPEIRDSAIDGVRKALSGATPEELHENWITFKIRHGYTYGPEKDAVKLTHPCLVPYDELPEEQRAKDALFYGIVNSLKGQLINASDFDPNHIKDNFTDPESAGRTR